MHRAKISVAHPPWASAARPPVRREPCSKPHPNSTWILLEAVRRGDAKSRLKTNDEGSDKEPFLLAPIVHRLRQNRVLTAE